MSKRLRFNKLLFLICILGVCAVCFVGCSLFFSAELSLDTSNAKLVIEQGEEFDYSAVKIYLTQNGNKRLLDLTEVEIGKLDTSVLGTHRVYVVYGKQKAFFTVKVTVPAVGELNIDVNSLPQKVKLNEIPDLSDAKATIAVDGVTIQVPSDKLKVEPFDNTSIGQRQVTVVYKHGYREYKANFEILVFKDAEFLLVDITALAVIYRYNEFDWSKVTVCFYDRGDIKTLLYGDYTHDEVNTSVAGKQTVAVYYNGLKAEFEIEVMENYTVTFEYMLGEQLKTEEIAVEINAYVTPPEVSSTENLYFVGWFIKNTDKPFDFDLTPITQSLVIEAKYFTKTEYIQNLIQQMQAETENILLSKTGNSDYRYTFLTEDYQNTFGVLFDQTVAKFTADQSWQQLDEIFQSFKLELDQCVKNTKTAVVRVKEFKESLDFSKLSQASKTQVERLFDIALEQMASFDGGAPSLDYIFYQLTLNVNFYFV